MGSAVNFIGEDEIGEDGTFFGVEGAGILPIGHRTDEVGGKEIGGKLNPLKLAIDDLCQRVAQKGFGESWDTFEKEMSSCEKGDHSAVDHVCLTDDDAGYRF